MTPSQRRQRALESPCVHWFESMSRTPIRDGRHHLNLPGSSFRRKPESRGVAGMGEPRSVGACSQPRIQHPANLMLLCGGAKAKGDSGMWCLPCL